MIPRLSINRTHFSRAFWSILFENSAFINDGVREAIQEENQLLEGGRDASDFNTGSISYSSSLCIASAAAYFKPKCVAEVGTFIGRSAFSLLKGAQLSGGGLPTIYSCDFSNDIADIHFIVRTVHVMFPIWNRTRALMSTGIHYKMAFQTPKFSVYFAAYVLVGGR